MCCIVHVQVIWHLYKQAMKEAGFSAPTGLYIASGVLTYGADDGEPLYTAHLSLQITAILLVMDAVIIRFYSWRKELDA